MRLTRLHWTPERRNPLLVCVVYPVVPKAFGQKVYVKRTVVVDVVQRQDALSATKVEATVSHMEVVVDVVWKAVRNPRSLKGDVNYTVAHVVVVWKIV